MIGQAPDERGQKALSRPARLMVAWGKPHTAISGVSMNRRTMSIRTTAVGSLAAGLLLSTAGPAAAQTFSKSDPTGDVVNASVETVPKRRLGDVTRTVVRHELERVVLRTKYARLDIKKRQPFLVQWGLSRPDDSVVIVRVRAERGSWAGSLDVDVPAPPLRARDSVECGTHKINYRRNFVRVVLPRDCLDRPHWFKVVSYTQLGDDPAFYDDGLQDGFSGGFRVSRKIWAS